MSCSRLIKFLVLITAISIICTNGVVAAGLEDTFDWKIPRAEMMHITRASIVNGKTEYNPTSGAKAPYFYYLYINLVNIPKGQTGEFTLNSKGDALVEYYNVSTQQQIGKTMTVSSGQNTYKIGPWPGAADYYVGGNNGGEADFMGASESTFSLQDFSFQVSGASETSGVFGEIRTTQRQMSRQCVPYMEFSTNGSALAAINWRFVNPSDPSSALTQDATNDVVQVHGIWIRTQDGKNHRINIDKRFAEGDPLEGALKISQSVQVKNIRFVEITFSFSDRLSTSCQTLYQWRFYPL